MKHTEIITLPHVPNIFGPDWNWKQLRKRCKPRLLLNMSAFLILCPRKIWRWSKARGRRRHGLHCCRGYPWSVIMKQILMMTRGRSPRYNLRRPATSSSSSKRKELQTTKWFFFWTKMTLSIHDNIWGFGGGDGQRDEEKDTCQKAKAHEAGEFYRVQLWANK